MIGDLQRTALIEFWRESNNPEREALVRDLAATCPDALFIVGDLVFYGSSARHWEKFDALMAPVRDAGIPAFAVFGNHDTWTGRAWSEDNLFARFPHLEGRHHHEVAYGPIRLVLLDSNIDVLSREEWADQRRWYQETLRRLDADPAVRGIVVLLHHPPYSNNTRTDDGGHVRRDLVLPFMESRKTMAMISGHVHSYERFLRGGKMFIVSGGGGGPRPKLDLGPERPHPDDLVQGPALRPFHYLLLAPGAGGIEFEARGLQRKEQEVRTLERFTLPWPEESGGAQTAPFPRARRRGTPPP